MLEQLIITIQIIIIDIVMAADNAIIIGLIASGFAQQNRKRIIAWGVAAAFIFRVIFAFGATIILEFAWLKIMGGALLLWIVNNLRQDFFDSKKVRSPALKSQERVSFATGFWRVLVADFTLSLDNVLGVVGAAKDHYLLMVGGLLLSVLLVATLASYFANYIKNHKWLGYVGLFVILIVALQLIIGGLINLEVLSINEKFEFLFNI
jgi:YjbE family integral membrane protein|tara:strand:- start:853 stop:1473 length:621 start_codon:yes stop_codon:yes gene_type:complete